MVRGTEGCAGGGNGCVEKLADYSIVGPVVSVNRDAPVAFCCLFIVAVPTTGSRLHPPRISEGAVRDSRKGGEEGLRDRDI